MKGNALNNEITLLEQISAGDAAAFRIVFDHYWDKIFSMAITYTKSSTLADDVVQDVFVKIWRNRTILPTIAKFDAYLFITARNELIDMMRKKDVVLVPFEESLYDTQHEDTLIPDQELSLKESQELIHDAVAKLPRQQQRIYQLSRNEGLSQQEIAEKLGISVNTVKVHMNKALHFIRQHIAARSGKANLLWLLILAAIDNK